MIPSETRHIVNGLCLDAIWTTDACALCHRRESCTNIIQVGERKLFLRNSLHFLTYFPIHSYFSCNIQLRTCWAQLLFAMSPLIALFYVIYTGFEPEEVERKKRMQTGDFQLDGHAE